MSTTFGRYELLDRIGMGGMAEVWRARVNGIGGFEKIVVIKKILPSFAQNKIFIDMLLAEARLCAMLQHANIVQVYENGENDGNFYIAMEYVPGHDLFKVLSQATQSQIRIPAEVCLYIAAEAAKGLHYAHNARDHYGRPMHIIHRDVSPSNIILSEAGEVKVMDFGVARATPGGQRENPTRSGVLKGKLGYMSPEQVTGREFDHRSDIFSLGIILYESLTLKRLFLAKTDLETLVNIRDARLEHKFKKHSYIDEDFGRVLRKSLAREPENRYPSALAMHDDIQQVLFDRRQLVSGSAVARFLTGLFDPAKQGQRTAPPSMTTSLPNDPASAERYDPRAASRTSGAVALPPTQPGLHAPAMLREAAAAGERVVPPPAVVAKSPAQQTEPASNSLSFSPADMAKILESVGQKWAEGTDADGTGDKAAMRATQQQPQRQALNDIAKALREPPPRTMGLPPQPTAQPVVPDRNSAPKPEPVAAAAVSSFPTPQLGRAMVSGHDAAARPVSPTPSFQFAQAPPITDDMALFDPDFGMPGGSHAPITDPEIQTIDDDSALSGQQSAVSGVIAPLIASRAATPDGWAAVSPSAPNAVVAPRNTQPVADGQAGFRPDTGSGHSPGSVAPQSASSSSVPQRLPTPTAFPAFGGAAVRVSSAPASAQSDTATAVAPISGVARPPFEIVEPSKPPFGQPEPSQRLAAYRQTDSGRVRVASERTADFEGLVESSRADQGPTSGSVDGAVLTDRGTQHSFDGKSDGQSFSVAGPVRNWPQRKIYRLRLANGTELGPMTLTNLESLLRARSVSVEDLVAVGDASYQPIRTVTSLTVIVAALAEMRPSPTLSGPLSQWVFVRLIYKAYVDRSTGVLELRRGDAVKSIYFSRGRTQYIASNQHQELLGPFMVANNYITQADVESAVARSKQTGVKLGDLMINMNFIKPSQLYQILERQLRAKFIDAFGWDSGTFAYYDGDKPPADIVPLDFDPMSVLCDGVRERVSLATLEPLFADKLDRPLHKVRNPSINLAALKLPSRESKMVRLLHSVQTPRQAYEECYNNRQHRLALLRVLFLMLQTELVTFDADRT